MRPIDKKARFNGKLFGISETCEFTRAMFGPDGEQGAEQCGQPTTEMFELAEHKSVGFCDRHAARILHHCSPVRFDFPEPVSALSERGEDSTPPLN